MNSTKSLADLAHAIEPIAREAGKVIMSIYPRAHMAVEFKGDESPVTEADRRAERVLKEGMEALDVDYPIVSEEGREIPFDERKKLAALWLVDPLDGTKEYVKRNGEFCTCIALIEGGRPTLGVIHAPESGKSWLAWKGGGVHVVEREGAEPKAVPARKPIDLGASGLRFGVSRSHLNKATTEYLSKYEGMEKVATGSALKFCAIAEDEIDVYPRLAPTMEWDTAAGECILTEAGGSITQLESGEPLTYNKEKLVNPSFIATARTTGKAKPKQR